MVDIVADKKGALRWARSMMGGGGEADIGCS